MTVAVSRHQFGRDPLSPHHGFAVLLRADRALSGCVMQARHAGYPGKKVRVDANVTVEPTSQHTNKRYRSAAHRRGLRGDRKLFFPITLAAAPFVL